MTTNTDLVKQIAEKVFPKSVFFEGVIHPTAKDNSYNGLFMREKDIQEWRSKIKDMPLWFNHNERKKIGQILAGYMDTKKQLRVMGIIDTSTVDGILIAEDVRAGKLNSLSMGKYAIADQTNGDKQIVGHDIFEVSIVENPDLEGTSIDYVQPHNESQKKAMEYQKARLALVNESETLTPAPSSSTTTQTNLSETKQKIINKEMNNKPEETIAPPKIETSTTNLEKQLEEERAKNLEMQRRLKELETNANPTSVPVPQKTSEQIASEELTKKIALMEKEQKGLENISKLIGQPVSSDEVHAYFQQKVDKKRKAVSESADQLRQQLVSNYETIGAPMDDNAKMFLNQMQSDPLSVAPFARILTVNGAAHKKSLSAMEKQFQEESALRKKAEEENNEFKKKIEAYNNELQKKQSVGNHYFQMPTFPLSSSSSSSSTTTNTENKPVSNTATPIVNTTSPSTNTVPPIVQDKIVGQLRHDFQVSAPVPSAMKLAHADFLKTMRTKNGLINAISKKQKTEN